MSLIFIANRPIRSTSSFQLVPSPSTYQGATRRLRCRRTTGRTKLCRAPYSMLLTSAQVPHICGPSHLDKSKVTALAETS